METEREREKEEGEKLASFFGAIYEFFNLVPVPIAPVVHLLLRCFLLTIRILLLFFPLMFPLMLSFLFFFCFFNSLLACGLFSWRGYGLR